jgi:hypothetical protein
MQFVIEKLALINASICHFHLPFVTFVVLPLSCELTSINPADDTMTFAPASIPVAFISGFFELISILAGQAVVIFHRAIAARSSIFELASKLVSILEVDHTETKK